MSQVAIPEPRNALPKGGSSLLQIGITDVQADAIWGERFQHEITSFDDANGALVIGVDRAPDYVPGRQFRVRDSGSNDGMFTVAEQPTWDDGSSELSIPVEETVTSETISGTPIVEPVWLRGGWQPLAKNLGGGSLTESRDASRVKDEFGTEVGEVVNNQEIVIANEVMANGDRFYELVKWLEAEYVEARYPLPQKQNGNFERIGGDRYADMRAFPRLSASATDREESLDDEEQRSLSFEVVASKPDAGSSYDQPQLRETLNIDVQGGWPSRFAPWKDDAYTSTRATS